MNEPWDDFWVAWSTDAVTLMAEVKDHIASIQISGNEVAVLSHDGTRGTLHKVRESAIEQVLRKLRGQLEFHDSIATVYRRKIESLERWRDGAESEEDVPS